MKEANGSDLYDIIEHAIEEMKHEQREKFFLEKTNLAKLQRRTGISRAKLRRLKEGGFVVKTHGLLGRKAPQTVLTDYTAILNKNSHPLHYQRSGVSVAASGGRISGWIDHC